MGVSRDAKHVGEVKNDFTSCFARQQEVPSFSSLQLLDSICFLRERASRDAKHHGDAKNVADSCFACQTGSASVFLPVIDLFVPFS